MSVADDSHDARGDEPWEDMALVGRIARAHGNRGEVIVNPDTDFPEARFQTGHTLYLLRHAVPQAITITSVRFHQGRPILGLEGFRSISEAETLAHAELRIPSRSLGGLPPDVYYRHDLVGCDVVTRANAVIGKVTAVEGTLTRSRLVVAGHRGEVLLPLVADICTQIDVESRKIVVDPPEGLIELNQTGRRNQ